MASSRSWLWLLLAALATVAAAQTSGPPEDTTDPTTIPTLTPEGLPSLPNGCLSPELHPDCFSASDVTASVVGTFFLTLALVLIVYAFHRLCWRVYNVKLANYAI